MNEQRAKVESQSEYTAWTSSCAVVSQVQRTSGKALHQTPTVTTDAYRVLPNTNWLGNVVPLFTDIHFIRGALSSQSPCIRRAQLFMGRVSSVCGGCGTPLYQLHRLWRIQPVEIRDSSIFVTFYHTEWHERAVIRPECQQPRATSTSSLDGRCRNGQHGLVPVFVVQDRNITSRRSPA
jgi:hypothetical protein